MTPDVSWDAACRKCYAPYQVVAVNTWIAPTVNFQPTMTGTDIGCYYDFFGTKRCGQVAVTNTPTPGPSPTPQATPTLGPKIYFVTNPGWVGYLTEPQAYNRMDVTTTHIASPIELYWWFPDLLNSSVVGYVVTNTIETGNSGNYPAYWLIKQGEGSYGILGGANIGLTANTQDCFGSADACLHAAPGYPQHGAEYITWPITYETGVRFELGSVGSQAASGHVGVSYIISGHVPWQQPTATPLAPPTVTPTPLPVGNSVCNSIVGYDPSVPDNPNVGVPGTGIVLAGPTIGWQQCYTSPYLDVDLSGFNLVLPFMQLGHIHLDQVKYCLDAVTLGTLTLFGMDVSLDLLLLTMGGLWFIRGLAGVL